MTQKKPKIGDVFLIPATNKLLFPAVVVEKYFSELYIGVLKIQVTNPAELELDELRIDEDTLSLLALTLDAKIRNGNWRYVGHMKVDRHTVPLPAYKIEMNDSTFIEDYTSRRRRIASNEEMNRLNYRKTIAPVRIEKALRAMKGQDEWHDQYEELLIPPVENRSSTLFK